MKEERAKRANEPIATTQDKKIVSENEKEATEQGLKGGREAW